MIRWMKEHPVEIVFIGFIVIILLKELFG